MLSRGLNKALSTDKSKKSRISPDAKKEAVPTPQGILKTFEASQPGSHHQLLLGFVSQLSDQAQTQPPTRLNHLLKQHLDSSN